MEIDKNTNNSKTPIIILYAAYAALFIGLGIGVYLIADYNYGYKDIEFKMKFADLGTLLGGTVGIFWSLGGILFFIYNLQQQKETLTLQREDLNLQRLELALQREELANQVKEMKDANETASQQQKAIAEQTLNNLYYNLLENNKKLVEFLNPEFFNGIKNTILTSCEVYKNGLDVKRFNAFDSTEYFPPYYLSYRQPDTTDNVKNFIDNVIDVITFINDYTDKKEFYHRMFFNQLSYTEKYLIGFAFTFKLWGTENIKANFNYAKSYIDNSGSYTYEYGYFPVLRLTIGNQPYISIFSYDGEPNKIKFKFNIFYELDKKLFLKKIIYKLSKLSSYSDPKILHFENDFDIEIIDDLEIDSTDLLKDFTVDNVSLNQSYVLSMQFIILYGDISYLIDQSVQIRFKFKSTGERNKELP